MRTVARRLTFLVVLALVTAGCTGGDEGGGGRGAQSRVDANAELKVGFTDDQYVLEGPDANLGAYPLNANIVETLTYLNDKYEVEPRLAERWEFRPPNTWRFFLRRGVTFHDGQPLNAQAVKVGLFDRVAQRRGGGTIKAGPDSAAVVDEFTVDFTPTTPNYRVPEQLVHPQNAVIAPNSDHGKKPIGTGPFRFVEYLPKERIVVERNPDYWGARPEVARILFRFYPDNNARLLALQAGDVDLIYQVSRDDVKALRDQNFNVVNSTVGAYRAMYLNVHGEAPYDILKDITVRRAIAMGIDRKKLVDGVLNGLGTTDQTFVPPTILGRYASEVKGHHYDLNRAKTMLDEAGWRPGADGIRSRDGRRLKLTLASGFPSAEALRPTPTFLQAELKNLGIESEIVERPDSASFQQLMQEKKADLFIEEGNQNDGNASFLPILLLYTGPGSSGSGVYQGIAAPGARFDELIQPALTEPDPDRLRRITAVAMNEAITEQVTVLPLAGIFRIYGMKKSITGFVPHPSFLNVSWTGVGVTTR